MGRTNGQLAGDWESKERLLWLGGRQGRPVTKAGMGRKRKRWGDEGAEAELVLVLLSDWRWWRSQRCPSSLKAGTGPIISLSPLPSREPAQRGTSIYVYELKSKKGRIQEGELVRNGEGGRWCVTGKLQMKKGDTQQQRSKKAHRSDSNHPRPTLIWPNLQLRHYF